MSEISDQTILSALDSYISGRTPGGILKDLYYRPSDDSPAFDALIRLLPMEQIATVTLVDRVKLSGLPAVVLLLATLREIRTNDGWIHFNLAKHLDIMLKTGMPEAKLPAIVHALLAVEKFRNEAPNALPFPLGVLATEMASFAPREAIRSGILAAGHGDGGKGLHKAAPALPTLGLNGIGGGSLLADVIALAKGLHLGGDHIPNVTSLGEAADVSSTVIEPPLRGVYPPVLGDSSHYIFADIGQAMDVPGVSVHTIQDGVFSIDATNLGLESHYVFDRNGRCILELANGAHPFIAETMLECDEPVAILDDEFSGHGMNICHFLCDRVTRISLYERAWSRPGKFLLIDDYPYYRDILGRMGLSDRVIIPSSKRISIRAPRILFSSNIAGDFRHPAHLGAGWAVNYPRQALGIGERKASADRKVMISRGDASGRGIINWDEVSPIFRRHGFDVVELAKLPTDAQIALFRDASQIVGVHGAGLTNALFAPRDCAVLEILPPMIATRAYWLVSSGLGQRYHALIADDPELPRPDYATWRHNLIFNNHDIVVPPARLEAALSRLANP